MRAILKRLYSPDIYNLESYIPPEEENFCFLLQAFIGPKDGEGEESFDIEVCTPIWLYKNLTDNDVRLGCYTIIIKKYDYFLIKNFIEKYINNCEGKTWNDIALKLNELGRWEFFLYKE